MGELFKEAGYKTAFLSNSNVLHHPNFAKGFQEVYYRKKWGVSGKGPRLSSRAGQFIEKSKDQKFMIYLHYLDPHGPYEPPPGYYLKFAKTRYPKPLSLYNFVRRNCHRLINKGFGPGDARFEDMVLRYDAEIAYIDKSIEILFAALRRHNLLDNTLVVITADHGEEFLEHRFVEHAWTLYNESLRVPLIFWAPGVLKSKRVKSLVSTVDILPTLLDLMGINHKRNDFDGTALFKETTNGFVFTPPSKPYIAELLIQHRNLLRVVVKDNWKYIAALKFLEPRERKDALKNVYEVEKDIKSHLDIWGPVIREELYDLSQDPDEQRPVVNKEKLHKMRAILQKYKKYCRQKKSPTPLKDAKKQKLSPEEIKRLKSLGYL
jgi:arylsulfatase A-like enzyme